MPSVRFIPLSAKREERAFTSGFSYEFVEAVINDVEQTVTFTRVSSENVTQVFTLSMEDLDEFYAEYDAHVTGDPRPSTGPTPTIDARGVAMLQRPRSEPDPR